MAFALLMSFYDYKGKIKQPGIHVWSEFWGDFIDKQGSKVTIIMKVDNTFDISDFYKTSSSSYVNWKKKTGEENQSDWYNETANSREQRSKVEMISVMIWVRYNLHAKMDFF